MNVEVMYGHFMMRNDKLSLDTFTKVKRNRTSLASSVGLVAMSGNASSKWTRTQSRISVRLFAEELYAAWQDQ
jgi:hypothetical protein